MNGIDVPAAWWLFWLTLGVAVFCGLIWTIYRLAVWSDESTWREYIGRRREPDAVTTGSQHLAETADH